MWFEYRNLKSIFVRTWCACHAWVSYVHVGRPGRWSQKSPVIQSSTEWLISFRFQHSHTAWFLCLEKSEQSRIFATCPCLKFEEQNIRKCCWKRELLANDEVLQEGFNFIGVVKPRFEWPARLVTSLTICTAETVCLRHWVLLGIAQNNC